MAFWTPEYMCPSFLSITPDFLLAEGISALLLDVDNTLIPYEVERPTEEVRAWLDLLKENGIRVAFVTNNKKKRLREFADGLNIPAYHLCCKPSPHKLRRAIRTIGAKKTTTAMLGDQLLTDMLAAHLAGIRSYIVPPIKDRRGALTRFKRWLEKPLVRRYQKQMKQGEKENR